MAKRFWWVPVLTFVLAVGCGPVSIGQQPTGDDDDDNATPTPPTSTATFSVSSPDPTLEMFIGEAGTVDVTISPVDGYTGTIDLSAKTVTGAVDVVFEETGSEVNQITLDGTNPVTLTVVFDSVVTEVPGQDITVPPAYIGGYDLEFTDGTDTAGIQIDAKVGPIFPYTLAVFNTTDDPNVDPMFLHTNSMTIPTGVAPVFVNNGNDDHVIHVNGGGSSWSHQNTMPGFINGMGWSPVIDQNDPHDLTNPVDLADLETNGVIPAGDAGMSPSYYCHTHGSGSHNGVNGVNVSIVAP